MNINACRFLSSSLVLLTFFGGMLALHVELDVLHNTLGAKKLALYSVGAGALLLLVLSPFERLLCAENEYEERWAIRVLVAVGILAGSVGVVSHTNQHYGDAAGHIEYLPILVTMRKGFNWQSCRRLFVPSLLVAALAAVMYFGLVPNRRQETFGNLPLAIGRQIGAHDDFNNFAAFTVLGILALRLGRGSADRRNPARWSLSRALRVAMLIGLICAIEAAQLWIPGRYSSLRDVATGSSGVVAAWVLCALVERVVKRRPPK